MPPFTDTTDDQALLREVVAHYHRRLQESPDALDWLARRAIQSSELVERFHLGLSDRTLGPALPSGATRPGAEVRARLQRLGILRESGHEHLAGSLVVPLFDEHGNIVQLYGRKVGDSFRAGTPLHLFLPGPLRGVWNVAGLTEPEVILCAGLIDAMIIWAAGVKYVTAALTLDEVPAEVLAALQARGVRRVLVAYPHDEKGDPAALEVIQALQEAGIEGVRVELPAGMGVNDLARRRGASALLDVLPRARPAAVAAPQIVTEGPSPTGATPEPVSEPADDPSGELVIEIEDRRYRVRGLDRNTAPGQLKVNLLASRTAEGDSAGFHVDTLDLYLARQRAAFVRQAAAELGVPEDVVKRDLGRMLLQLEEAQEELLRRALAPKVQPVTLTEAETAEAMALLRDPHLLDRVLADFDRLGIVGEEGNKLVGHIAAVSRKLDQPLAVVIQSSSAAGKSSLLEAILALVPPEDRLKYAAMTPQSVYYLGATDLRHKVLAVLEDQGAEKVSYALKILQSEGELNIASTGKEASTGRLVTHEYKVSGPVALFFTTTAVQVDEELLNRCVVLSVSEDRQQTRAIHALQRRRQTLAGITEREEREGIIRLHQNAQRLLQPVLVANPYAPRLTFLDHRTRTRRDHAKYLGLIRAVTLLHQHQREVKTTTYQGAEMPYIEVTLADIAVANRLADHVFGRSLDELPPHTRNVLVQLDELVGKGCAEQGIERTAFRFTRRDALAATGLSLSQLKIHLGRLIELEHLLVHRGRRGELYQYKLVFDRRAEQPVLSGLTDPASLAGVGGGMAGPEPGEGRSANPTPSTSDAAPLRGPWPAEGEEEARAREEARPTPARVEGEDAP